MWVEQQLSFDRMHENAKQIFQVNALVTDETGIYKRAVTPAPLAGALVNDLPEVQEALRIDVSGAVVKSEDQQFVEQGILATDPSFFDFFDFKLLKGNAATALSEPYSVVISEQTAKKYFGDGDPINQSLRIFQYDPEGNGAEYKITGIIEDCPIHSHFDYSMLISFKTIEVAEPESLTDEGWRNNEYYTYILLEPLALSSTLDAKFPSFLQKYLGSEMDKQNISYQYFLTALTDIHFATDVKYGIQPGTSKSYILIFSAIGIIVLILACINYISLSTAYSTDQFKEVGVRKALGASRTHLVLQYLVESWLLAMTAMIASIAWIVLSKSTFENIFGLQLTGLYTFSSLGIIFGVASLAGIISGIYPALILSSFHTINILKGQFSKGSSGAVMRKGLVVLQYSITIILITGILIVRKQLHYVESKNLGFDQENLLVLASNGSPEVIPGYEGFANELKSLPGIAAIARSNTSIGGGLDKSSGLAESAEGNRIGISVYTARIDHDYLNTYQMSLLAGRNFMPGNAADSSRGYIINEAAARFCGYRDPKDAVGKFFSVDGRHGEVVGVVQDFHYADLHENIEPAALSLLNGYFSRITVRMTGEGDKTSILIANAWKKHYPETVVDFTFLDDRLQQSYKAEDRFSRIFFIFSIISITIASLGLFALVSYQVERRSKEIGIRKVLGGSAIGISTMLSVEFFLLVVMSYLIAIPVGWYFMDKWLQNFAYHISIGAGIFLTAAIISISIAMGTVGLKTIRSALRNPVDSLRTE
jgi:putative ABC transport system permease protein